MKDLSGSMDSSIGPPRANRTNCAAKDFCQCLINFVLYGLAVWLLLLAIKLGTIIGT